MSKNVFFSLLEMFLSLFPDSPTDCINNLSSLRDYLKEQEEEENRLQRGWSFVCGFSLNGSRTI